MKILQTFLLVLAGLMLVFGCEKSKEPTKPPVSVLPDTTSHDFTWQSWTFGGDVGSSSLRDVAIIDENNIWAVGAIYLKDSLGQPDPLPYNAVHWDGSEWTLKRITVNFRGNLITPPLEGVFAFSANDIWFSSGVPIHGDGQSWTQYHLFDMGVLSQNDGSLSKPWGSSSSSLYFVGRKGTIVYYNRQRWQKLESGTNLDIQDIWGGKDASTGEYTILAVASSIFTSYEKEILRITETAVSSISTSGIDWPVDALWFDPGRIYYAVGAGIYTKNSLAESDTWGGPKLSLTQYTTHGIRGNHLNDVFVVGAFGDVLHYNGRSWRSYREQTALAAGSYKSVAVKGDYVFAVGENADKAVVLRGKR
jgi:hypothetical protein